MLESASILLQGALWLSPVVAALWVISRSAPHRVRADAAAALDLARVLERSVLELRRDWDVTLERMEELAEVMERRRRRIAAHEQRERQQQPTEPATHEQRLSAVRRLTGLTGS